MTEEELIEILKKLKKCPDDPDLELDDDFDEDALEDLDGVEW